MSKSDLTDARVIEWRTTDCVRGGHSLMFKSSTQMCSLERKSKHYGTMGAYGLKAHLEVARKFRGAGKVDELQRVKGFGA
jgi:hypothetical protein